MVLVLVLTSTCVAPSVSGVGLVAVPITSVVDAGLCIFCKNVEEYLKRKEQHFFELNNVE